MLGSITGIRERHAGRGAPMRPEISSASGMLPEPLSTFSGIAWPCRNEAKMVRIGGGGLTSPASR